jgi:hypothetical protein
MEAALVAIKVIGDSDIATPQVPDEEGPVCQKQAEK